MKKLYTLAAFVALGFSSIAQNFDFSSEQHIEDVMTDNFGSYYINFTTETPEEITFKFDMISNSLPQAWDYSLCDYTNCYVGVPTSGTMTTISLDDAQNGTVGFFSLTINNKGYEGAGLLELYVYDSNDYERGDTVSWNIVFGDPVSTLDLAANDSFKVYPNPASDVLNIESDGLFAGTVFNGLGEKVLSVKGNNIATVDVSNLVKGIYFIAGQNESGQPFNRQFIIQ